MYYKRSRSKVKD